MEIEDVILELRNMQKYNFTRAPDEVFDMAISALDKQDAKKPTHEETPYMTFACPRCGNLIRYQYCPLCGQKIDWSE